MSCAAAEAAPSPPPWAARRLLRWRARRRSRSKVGRGGGQGGEAPACHARGIRAAQACRERLPCPSASPPPPPTSAPGGPARHAPCAVGHVVLGDRALPTLQQAGRYVGALRRAGQPLLLPVRLLLGPPVVRSLGGVHGSRTPHRVGGGLGGDARAGGRRFKSVSAARAVRAGEDSAVGSNSRFLTTRARASCGVCEWGWSAWVGEFWVWELEVVRLGGSAIPSPTAVSLSVN